MKDGMIDIMVSMMPYMKPLMWSGLAFSIIGLTLVAMGWLLKKELQTIINWTGRFVLAVAVFFISAQIAGYFLSMPPTINFGDASKFEFNLVSFWQIGIAFLVVALLIRYTAGLKRQATA